MPPTTRLRLDVRVGVLLDCLAGVEKCTVLGELLASRQRCSSADEGAWPRRRLQPWLWRQAPEHARCELPLGMVLRFFFRLFARL